MINVNIYLKHFKMVLNVNYIKNKPIYSREEIKHYLKDFIKYLIAAGIGVVGYKLIYNKGRKDEAKYTYEYLSDTVDTFKQGVELRNKESK